MEAWMAAEARPIPQISEMSTGSKFYNSGLRDDETGEVITFEEYFAANAFDETAELPPPGMTLVAWQIPGSEYPAWMWRETAVMGGIAAVAAVLFVFKVLRRTPE